MNFVSSRICTPVQDYVSSPGAVSFSHMNRGPLFEPFIHSAAGVIIMEGH